MSSRKIRSVEVKSRLVSKAGDIIKSRQVQSLEITRRSGQLDFFIMSNDSFLVPDVYISKGETLLFSTACTEKNHPEQLSITVSDLWCRNSIKKLETLL